MKIPAILQRQGKPDIRLAVESVEREGFKIAPPLDIQLTGEVINGKLPRARYIGRAQDGPAIYRAV